MNPLRFKTVGDLQVDIRGFEGRIGRFLRFGSKWFFHQETTIISQASLEAILDEMKKLNVQTA